MKRFKPSTQYDFVTGTFVATKSEPKRKKDTSATNKLTSQISKYVQSRGGWCMRINVSGFYREDVGYIKSGSTVGVPDLHAIFKGFFVGIEVKTGADTQSNEQKEVQKCIENAGGVYLLATNFESFKADFENAIKRF